MSRSSYLTPRHGRAAAALLATSALALTAAMSAASAAPVGFPPPAQPAQAPAGYLLGHGSVSVPVTADAYSIPTAATRKTGAFKVVMVGTSATDHRTGYLQFQVAGLPANAENVQATLTVTVSGKPVGATLSAAPVTGSWTEAAFDAANAPAAGTAVVSVPAVGGAVSFAVGSVANGVVSYAVRGSSANGLVVPLVSREVNAASSHLSISYDVPPPATKFGESIYANGTPWTDAVAAADTRYGRSAIDRVYYGGLPAAWPGNAGTIGRDVVVSFKIAPAQVLSGSLDAQLTNWFATAPTDREVYWSYYHEPEDNIAAGTFTAADYRAAWAHLSALAHAVGNPHLHATLILMGWTLNPASGRNVADYYPGSAVVDDVAWDVYSSLAHAQNGAYDDPASLFGPAVAQAAAWGKPFGFAEWGSALAAGDSGAGRAAWITASASYMSSVGAAFSTYFDSMVGGPYQLLDASSIAAYHGVVSGS